MISLVIPTYNRHAILAWHLQELNRQTLKPNLFEVIVVDDGSDRPFVDYLHHNPVPIHYPFIAVRQDNKGPATARNLGASLASHPIIMFAGDDTIPTPNLLWRHYYGHLRWDMRPQVVQGYIDWHPLVPPDDFMRFITGEGGQQFNWKNMRHDDGSWKEDAPGWFVTANCSITRQVFLDQGGFDEGFPNAAWEDIELATRLVQFRIPSVFEPEAVNLHYHRITLDGFVKRQIMEGRSRLRICALHPEIASGFLDPAGLRNTNTQLMYDVVNLARELHYSKAEDVQDERKTRWGQALQLASLEGIRQGLSQKEHAWQAIIHLHKSGSIRGAVGAAAAIDRGDPVYALAEAQWCVDEQPDNWAVYCVLGEAMLANSDPVGAREAFSRALDLGATGEKWPIARIKEIG